MQLKKLGFLGLVPALFVCASVLSNGSSIIKPIEDHCHCEHNHTVGLNSSNDSEYIFEEEKDMSYLARKEPTKQQFKFWSSSNGHFGTFENWLFSDKGISFEFKFKEGGAKSNMATSFTFNGTAITNVPAQMYLFKIVNNEPVSYDCYDTSVTDHTCLPGIITKLTGDDAGWYRYDLYFARLGKKMYDVVGAANFEEFSHKTINGICFPWASANDQDVTSNWTDMILRKMKYLTPNDVIESSKGLGADGKSVDGRSNPNFPVYPNFFSSDKIYYIEYQSLNDNLRGTYINNFGSAIETKGPTYLYNTGSSTQQVGKLWKYTENGTTWKRYEVKGSETKSFLGYSSGDYDLLGLADNWGYLPTIIRKFGLKEAYDYKVTFKVTGLDDDIEFMSGKAIRPTNPTAPSGKHFKGWFTDEGCTQTYDFDSDLTQDITLYGKFEDHSYSWKYDANKHWQECSCGDKKDEAAHSMEYQHDETQHWGACSVCGYSTTKVDHVLEWKHNETQHWQECECGYATAKVDHVLEWKHDATQHWQECECGYATTKADHTLVWKYDGTQHWQECECGYATTKVDHVLEWKHDATQHWQECECGYTTTKEDHTLEWKFDDNQHWKECETCGYTTTKSNHDFKEDHDEKYLKEAATCVSPAVYYKSCECGCVSDETFTFGEVDPTNHVHTKIEMANYVAPTCETDGGYDEAVVCHDCGAIVEVINHVVIEKTGHDYKATNWKLSDDKSSGTVTLVCQHDSSHTKTLNATVVATVEKEATTEEEGIMAYTLTAVDEGKTYSEVIKEAIPKKEKKGGCGGSITAVSTVASVAALGSALLLIARKKKVKKVK